MSRADKKDDKKVIAVVIAESFNGNLQPATNPTTRPPALLPIGNTPLIDYVLESLVFNAIDEVRIFAYDSARQIESHLSKTVLYTGKSWMNSSEIKIKCLRGSAGINTITGALRDILERSQLPEHFLLIPIDRLVACGCLRSFYQEHITRNRADPHIVLSAGCVTMRSHMENVHRAVVEQQIEKFCEDNIDNSPSTTGGGLGGGAASGAGAGGGLGGFPQTPLTGMQFGNDSAMNEAHRALESLGDFLDLDSHLDFISVALDPKNNSRVSSYQLWRDFQIQQRLGIADGGATSGGGNGGGGGATNPTLPITMTKNVHVRSDLALSGIYAMSQTAVTNVLQAHVEIADMNELLRYLVDNWEIQECVFAVDVLNDLRTARGALGTLGMAAPTSPQVAVSRTKSTLTAMTLPPKTAAAATAQPTGALADPDDDPFEFDSLTTLNYHPPAPTVVQPQALAQQQSQKSRNTHAIIVIPISSPKSYIQANVALCERQLFPLTRDANFADASPAYAVWREHPSVYLHGSTARVSSNADVGPNVILGEGVHFPHRSIVENSVIGHNVRVGEGAQVRQSVIMNNVLIGKGATLQNCIVGSDCYVEPGCFLNHCVLGDGVKLQQGASKPESPNSSTPPTASVLKSGGQASSSPRVQPLHYTDLHLYASEDGTRDVSLVGEYGQGLRHATSRDYGAPQLDPRQIAASTVTTELGVLFKRDILAQGGGGGGDEVSCSDDDNDGFLEQDTEVAARKQRQGLFKGIRADIGEATHSATSLQNKLIGWAHVKAEFALCGADDMVWAITRALVEYVGQTHADEKPKIASKALNEIFAAWLEPIYDRHYTKAHQSKEHCMKSFLAGLCEGLMSPDGEILQERGPQILSCVVFNADKTVYDARGYCIVSLDALFSYDDEVRTWRKQLKKRQKAAAKGEVLEDFDDVDDAVWDERAVIVEGWECLQETVDGWREDE